MSTIGPLSYRNSVLIAASALLLVACVHKGPAYRENYNSWAPDKEPGGAETVAVLGAKDLGRVGLGLDQRRKLKMPADFPTKADPHILLGIYQIGYSSSHRGKKLTSEQVRGLAVTSAATHGANAIYQDLTNDTVYFLYLSSASPVFASAKEILGVVEKSHFGNYRRVGDEQRTLDHFSPVSLPTRARHCYAVAIALDDDATLSDDLGFQIALEVKSRKYDAPEKQSLSFRGRPPKLVREFVAELGCFATGDKLALRVHPATKGIKLGTGKLLVRTYSFAISAQQRKHGCADLSGNQGRSAREEGLCLPR